MTTSKEATDLLPRNSYFHAVDRQMETDSYPSKIIPTEQGRRHKLLTLAIQDAENLIGALKTAKHFDRLGNIEHALPQITDALADVVTKANNFVSDVEVSTARYRGAVAESSNEAAGRQPSDPAAAVESPDVPAAAASSPDDASETLTYYEWQDPTANVVPKPGPHLLAINTPKLVSSDELRGRILRSVRMDGGRR
ncbi:hypothetical protein M1D89_10080 [Arthrobacter sp. D3-18]